MDEKQLDKLLKDYVSNAMPSNVNPSESVTNNELKKAIVETSKLIKKLYLERS